MLQTHQLSAKAYKVTDYVRPNFLVLIFTFLITGSFVAAQNSASITLVTYLESKLAKSEEASKYAQLKASIETVLRHHFQEKENSEKRSPWGVMHAMVAFGPHAEMYGDGKIVKDVDWLCDNEACRGMKLLKKDKGRLGTNNGPGRQGHDGQFLAILAQSQIEKERKLIVDGTEFSIEDLIQYEMSTCRANEELTFKLIGLSHYIDSDQIWKSNDQQTWNLERVIKEELRQSVIGAACGGTHRLMGFSYALLMRRLQNKPITGDWKRAEAFVREFRNYSFKLQNHDGSFSTRWFEGRGMRKDIQRRVQTTGHILEWLVFSAEESELSDPRLVKAVDYLSSLMVNNRKTKWEIGPKGHAVRALRLFYEKVLLQPATSMASSNQSKNYLADPRISQSSLEADVHVNETSVEQPESSKKRTPSIVKHVKTASRKTGGTPDSKSVSESPRITADDLPELPLLIR